MLTKQMVEGHGTASGFEGKSLLMLPATTLCTVFEEQDCAFSSTEQTDPTHCLASEDNVCKALQQRKEGRHISSIWAGFQHDCSALIQ